MPNTQLTPEDHAFFLEHDYLIVKNVVAPDVIAEAVAFLEAVSFEGEHDFWHVEGDKRLVRLAGLLRQSATGPVYRTGGGEFTLVMPQMTHGQALSEAARFCTLVSAHDFALPDGRAVTVTAGVAHAPDHAVRAQTLLDAADALLRGEHKAYLRHIYGR